jgi:hypothetical protein
MVACPSALPRKRPLPCDEAIVGLLEAHTAVVLTFTEAAVTMQTTRSPASRVGTLHVKARPVPGDGVGAVAEPFPHADAIDNIALRATMRLIGMAAEMIANQGAGGKGGRAARSVYSAHTNQPRSTRRLQRGGHAT